MPTKIKGIYKSFKYITQIFVAKERDMEIGYPTDVKHVAHIGWEAPSGSGPSWMNEFKTAPDFSTSIGSFSARRDLNPPPNYEEPPSGRVAKKPNRKKIKSTSPKSKPIIQV
ncbi:hypothetical protein TanjilG_07573 [Lupinus angustifolius]|uniref:CRIB domain-containing protein n=1 Tax=Lupinus angustifolius TaxID=3871 RepID=A0A1J7FX35_LUPAN|nr:PREDICTED: CRIB domain-containing protein RIC10-like [Lupinus angustifolius]OIV92582.1 hypothetical protein TanjilG_07573 [Lupinus angustifolius]